jgi:fatty-acyl-CoA synthase
MTTPQLSHVIGATDVPLLNQTIGEYFDLMVSQFAEREALVVCHQNIRWTYGELRERVDNLAVALLRLGLKPGERIGIWSPNRAEWVLAQFATAKAGLVLVNINPAYRLVELEYALTKVGCRALITAPGFKTSDYLEMLNTLAPELATAEPGNLHAQRLPDLRWVIRLGDAQTPGMLNFDSLLTPASVEEMEHLYGIGSTLHADDPVNIQFTSGTTGSPKGASLSHRNILNNGYFVGEAMRLTEADRMCIPVPLYHCFGMVIGNLACMTHGAVMIYPAEGFEAGATLKAVESERCTGLHGVPTMFIACLDLLQHNSYDLSSLRTGVMAGSPCPIEVMRKVIDRMGMRDVTICYGMTETSPVSFQSSTHDPLERRVGTVGRVHPHLEVKIVNEQGETLPRGTQGELCTKGYAVMAGYWNDKAKTAEVLINGWMHTGDLATLDEEGYCNITGRSKDLVIRGGENISPREVEEFLYRHPKVRDVQCVGVPDARYGEQLCACIVLHEGVEAEPEEFRQFCQGQIAHFKIPHYVRFVTAFPMTVTGKVQKYLLRQQMADELGLVAEKTA